MRSHKLVLILGVTLLAGLFVMYIGCGSDDNKSTDNLADYSDPEFLVVQEEVGYYVDSTLEFFTNGLGNIYGLATDTVVDPVQYVPGPIDPATDSISATYNDGWHVVYIALNRETFVSILRDSIQFLKDGQPQQNSTDLDNLIYRHFWTYNVTDTTVTYKSFVGNANYSFAGLNTSEATITGTDDFSVHSKYVSTDSTVWRDININATLNDIQVKKAAGGWVHNCPCSGSITAAIEMVYQKDSAAPDTTSWTVHLSFDNGNVSTVLTKGEFMWSYDEQICTPPGN